jgi:predicted metal-binding membrane protein
LDELSRAPPVATKASAIESLLERDRLLVVIALALLGILSWIYLVVLARDMAAGDMSLMGMGEMGVVPMNHWTLNTFALALLMWCIMMIGMMVPSAAPMILLFAVITRKQSPGGNPGTSIAIFIASYLIIWAIFSLFATLAQWALTEVALLSPMMVSNSNILTIGLLLACGTYQLSPLKQACLGKCRSPLSFLMNEWQQGNIGALKMGLSHGAYCVGCCWLLMALLFIGGVMNLLWIAMIAGLALMEKVFPHGELLGKLGGAMLLALASYMLFTDLSVLD